jgi:hypothetical protein
MRGRVPAQLWSVASVHPARYARDNYAPAGLLARDLEVYLQPTRLLTLMRNGLWADTVAYSCGGSRGLAVGFTVSRVPV